MNVFVLVLKLVEIGGQICWNVGPEPFFLEGCMIRAVFLGDASCVMVGWCVFVGATTGCNVMFSSRSQPEGLLVWKGFHGFFAMGTCVNIM